MSFHTASVGMNLARAGLGSRNALLANRALLRSVATRRFIQTETISSANEQDLLNSQRLKRPSSPHFTIYQPQLSWVASIAHRMTGVGLGVLLYGFSISYIAAPPFGVPFDGADIVSLVHGLPEWAKMTGKVILAAPFTFHGFNGLRHLSWDVGKFLTVKGAWRSGYTVIAAATISTVALVAFF